MSAPLDRPELSLLLELLDTYIRSMRKHKNESDDLFMFRQKNFYTVKAKLHAMHQEVQPLPITLLTTNRNAKEGNGNER